MKAIPGYPGYFASTDGDIYSKKREIARKLKPYLNVCAADKTRSKAYPQVVLMLDGKRNRRRPHRLVYITFVGPIPPKNHIHHIDGNPANNRVDNLKAIHPQEHCHLHNTKPSEGKELGSWDNLSNTEAAPIAEAVTHLQSTKTTQHSASLVKSPIKETPEKPLSGQKKTTPKQLKLFSKEPISPLANVDLALRLSKSLTTECRNFPVLLCKLLITLIQSAILLDNISAFRPRILRGLDHSGKLDYGANIFGNRLGKD